MSGVMIDRARVLLEDRLGGRLQRDVPLGPMTTYRVGGSAAMFVEAASIEDLVAIAEARAVSALPVLVVGRGSNMLISDDGFDGLALSITGLAGEIELPPDLPPTGTAVTVAAGGAVALPVLARRTAAAGITGFEWAVGVPGSIGGAVRMNAGGHGSDIAASLIDVDVFDIDMFDTDRSERRGLVTIAADQLSLRFRASSLAASHVVCRARLRLAAGDREASEAEIAEVVRWRRDHQPGGQNCGSVFVNPVPGELSAGELIDRLGLRGLRIGTAEVSPKHANFIQADDGGRAADVRALIEDVRRRVREATGFALRSEVRMVGFADIDPLSFEGAC